MQSKMIIPALPNIFFRIAAQPDTTSTLLARKFPPYREKEESVYLNARREAPSNAPLANFCMDINPVNSVNIMPITHWDRRLREVAMLPNWGLSLSLCAKESTAAAMRTGMITLEMSFVMISAMMITEGWIICEDAAPPIAVTSTISTGVAILTNWSMLEIQACASPKIEEKLLTIKPVQMQNIMVRVTLEVVPPKRSRLMRSANAAKAAKENIMVAILAWACTLLRRS